MDPSTDGMETRRTVTLPQVVRILWTCPLPWSSLVEGCIGPIVKLFYDKPTKKYPAHACEHSIHV